MIGALPETLEISGATYGIRSDYRNVLQVFEAFSDPELYQEEKLTVAVYLLLEPFICDDDVEEAIKNGFDAKEAIDKIMWFISAGMPEKDVLEKPVFNWQQDEQMIFSAVNKVAGKEVRELTYLHWWTFLGYFREIDGEGTFSFVTSIRNKLNKGKKLEKYEKDFLNSNKELVRLQRRKTKEELEEEAERKAILDEVL